MKHLFFYPNEVKDALTFTKILKQAGLETKINEQSNRFELTEADQIIDELKLITDEHKAAGKLRGQVFVTGMNIKLS